MYRVARVVFRPVLAQVVRQRCTVRRWPHVVITAVASVACASTACAATCEGEDTAAPLDTAAHHGGMEVITLAEEVQGSGEGVEAPQRRRVSPAQRRVLMVIGGLAATMVVVAAPFFVVPWLPKKLYGGGLRARVLLPADLRCLPRVDAHVQRLTHLSVRVHARAVLPAQLCRTCRQACAASTLCSEGCLVT